MGEPVLLSVWFPVSSVWLPVTIVFLSVFSGNMGEPVLLSVWFPVPSVYHLNHLSITNLYCNGVFPVVWGGKRNSLIHH